MSNDSQRHALPTNTHSSWQQGATAARAGKQFKDNPYSPLNYHFVTWGNGWLMAAHQIAKEQDEEL